MSEISGTVPADPAPAPNYRVVRAIVIGLGVLMVVMFGAVVAGLFIKIKHDSPAAPSDAPVVFTLAPGDRIASSETTADRLILHLKTPAGDEIDIIDTESGHLIGQVKTAPGTTK